MITAGCLALAFTTPNIVQAEPAEVPAANNERPERPARGERSRLTPEQREEMRAKMEQRRAELIAKYDRDGDGELSPEERRAAMEDLRAKMVAEFDADGDGELSPEERRNAVQTMRARGEWPLFPGQARRAARRGGDGDGPARGRGRGRGARGN